MEQGVIIAPKNWPFHSKAEMDAAEAATKAVEAAAKKTRWEQRMYARVQNRCEREKQMDKDADELNADELRARKKAKKTSKSMEKHKHEAPQIANSWTVTMVVPPSQGSEYEKGNVKDKNGNGFLSQDGLKMFRNGHESD